MNKVSYIGDQGTNRQLIDKGMVLIRKGGSPYGSSIIDSTDKVDIKKMTYWV